MLFGYDKTPILKGETPLDFLPRMSDSLGIELYIKRDDMTPLATGGNKLRKLEYLLHDAQTKGATTLLTVGGVQTNHGRLTAAVAAAHGLGCTILCIDEYPGEISANLLLDRLMGAKVIIRKSDGRPEGVQLDDLVAKTTAALEAKGETVYSIPVGGSNLIGLLGYVDCGLELARQTYLAGLEDATVVSAVGSMGTYLGLFCGFKHVRSPLRLKGVAISNFDEAKKARLLEYFKEARQLFGFDFDAQAGDFDVDYGYVRGGYNLPSREVRQAVQHLASLEGILLDPCYTGKTFAGLMDMVREGKIAKGSKVIFLHTGGVPGLYTLHHRREFEAELIDGVDY